ncbi:MFS transporter [Burkholderia sp. WAC0059]|uniref:MFS transporter n=1 Tax=Burkholderia sp. WAC0059 TaxID=2066022 RepID=UPI0011AF52BE|nr:MFS transporter [Burkholderia sp. WAC0059]
MWRQSHHHENGFLLYVSGGALVSLVIYWLMPETKGRELTRSRPTRARAGDLTA